MQIFIFKVQNNLYYYASSTADTAQASTRAAPRSSGSKFCSSCRVVDAEQYEPLGHSEEVPNRRSRCQANQGHLAGGTFNNLTNFQIFERNANVTFPLFLSAVSLRPHEATHLHCADRSTIPQIHRDCKQKVSISL